MAGSYRTEMGFHSGSIRRNPPKLHMARSV
jgi:hypothetical protein